MISSYMQFHLLHHANWIGEIQELVVLPQMRDKSWQSASPGRRRHAWAGAELTELSTNITNAAMHTVFIFASVTSKAGLRKTDLAAVIRR